MDREGLSMDDLIRRQAAIDAMCELMHHWFGGDPKDEIREIKRELEKLPSSQLEIIRCKDCKYSRGEPIADGRYWCIESCGYFQFCSEAERKEE